MSSSSPSLAGRAAMAVALMIGFYVLALAIVAGLLFLLYAMVVYANRVNLQLLLFALIGAGTILWSIIPRWDSFEAPGPRLTADKHPELFKAVSDIAQKTDQPMPAEVYLVSDMNAWVAHRGGMMGLGSRPVMGLGLPLMQLLGKSQFLAVLAHEFGHYHGGDTKLGPWIYKTRAAIGRTINNMGDSVLQMPFNWYGNLFLRITHAISRRQEFAADALAAQVVGGQAMIDSLHKVHGGAMAYDYYWSNEVAPVLNAGYRPPLASGFKQFMAVESIAESLDKATEEYKREAKVDPFDTHPPLPDRVAAIEALSLGEGRADDTPAVAMLQDVSALEYDLLAHLAGAAKVDTLKTVSWGDVGATVYVPMWKHTAIEQRAALQGVTANDLPTLAQDITPFAEKLVFPQGANVSSDQRKQYAPSVIGCALATMLDRAGWSLDMQPGDAVVFIKDEQRIEPFNVMSRLGNKELTADEWRQRVEIVGVAEMPLSIPNSA